MQEEELCLISDYCWYLSGWAEENYKNVSQDSRLPNQSVKMPRQDTKESNSYRQTDRNIREHSALLC